MSETTFGEVLKRTGWRVELFWNGGGQWFTARLIIITNTPQNEMKLARTFTSVSRDIIRRLNSAGRLCKIQETDKVIVYEYGVCRGLLR